MNIVKVVIFLLVVGVVLWLLGDRIHPTLRNVILALIILAVCVWLLDAFGIVTLPSALRLGK